MNYISPNIPANVLRRFFIVSSASSATEADKEPWRENPDRCGTSGALGTEVELTVELCEAENQVTVGYIKI